MTELRIGRDIALRLARLGAEVLSIARRLPSGEYRHVAQQLVRAGTSCGANYEEARGAQSRADFIHKVSIAAKEARETVFWLGVLDQCTPDLVLAPTLDEARQLSAILSASSNTARRNASK